MTDFRIATAEHADTSVITMTPVQVGLVKESKVKVSASDVVIKSMKLPLYQDREKVSAELNLSSLELSSIPGQLLRSFSFIVALHLNNNNISKVSKKISHLKSLKVLNLSNNKISGLPPSLGMVVTLEELRLSNNKLQMLPFEMGGLSKLTLLALDQNPLHEPFASVVRNGPVAAVTQFLRDRIAPPPPPPTRTWQQVKLLKGCDLAPTKESFILMSYNIMSDTKAKFLKQTYSFIPSTAFDWEQRKDRILDEIKHSRAHIVCLQEVEAGAFRDCLAPGLAATHVGHLFSELRHDTAPPETRDSVDGSAIFYNKSMFDCLASIKLNLREMAIAAHGSDKASESCYRAAEFDSVCGVCVLESRHTKERVIVATTHLFWKYEDVRLVQAVLIASALHKLVTETYPGAHLVFCGDLNGDPTDATYRYLSTGQVDNHDPALKGFSYQSVINRATHDLVLVDSYNSPTQDALTTYISDYEHLIDYIWYRPSKGLHLNRTFSLVSREYFYKQTLGLPTIDLPSDHTSVMAEFSIITPPNHCSPCK